MSMHDWLSRTAGLLLTGVAAFGSSMAMAQNVRETIIKPQPRDVLFVVEEGAAEGQPPVNDGDVFPAYWVGLSCDEDLGPALRAQLGLPEGQGLIVRATVKDAPAEKAGLKEHDVLVSAAGQPLKTLRDLVEAVQAAKETELTVDLLRGGKPESIKITPAKRPEGPAGGAPGRIAQFPVDPRGIRDWAEKFRENRKGGDHEFQFFLPQPGVMLPPGTHAGAAKLPDDMSLSVTKQGGEPAKIVVKQGEQSWEVTEDKLDDLPPEVRQHVAGFLGRHPLRMHIQRFEQAVPQFSVPGRPVAPPGAVQPAPGQPIAPPRPAPDSVDRLEQLQNELRRLQDAVEKLRQEGSEKKE